MALSAAVYFPFYSDGSLDFYLQFSLLINFLFLMLFSIDARMNPKMDLAHYMNFALNNLELVFYRMKDLCKNIFWLALLITPLCILFDTEVVFTHRLTFVVLLMLQSLITMFISIILFDLLKKENSEKHFFLIPLLMIPVLNFAINSDINIRWLSIIPFGGLVFTPLILYQNLSFSYAAIIFVEVLTLTSLFMWQIKLKVK